MQAFVRSKHTQTRRDVARGVLADLESLKVAVPDLSRPRQTTTTAARQSIGHSRSDSRSEQAPALPLSPGDLADFDDVDDFDAGLPALPEDKIEQLKQQKLREIEQIRSIDKYIEGDSYPDTTSGRLTDDGVQPFSQPPALMQASSAPLKRSKSNDKHTRRESEAPAPREQPNASQAAMPYFSRGSNATPDISGFQMAKRGQPQQKIIEKKASRKRVAVQQHATAVYEPRNEGPQSAGIDDHHPDTLPSYWDGSVATEVQISNHPAAEQPAAGSIPEPNHTAQLDFDIGILENMQYEKLKQESFDLDPRAPIYADIETVDLSSLSSDQWIDHFRSLPLEKWEESGDWLVEQYAQISNKLKELRRERRDIARVFENEVEERHNIIVKRRIIIRDTMEGMRTHGTQVLVKNTPT